MLTTTPTNTTSTPTTTTPATSTSTTSTQTTTTPTTTTQITLTQAACQDKNVTLYVTSDGERALLEVTPDIQTRFAVGSHTIHRDNCTINIIVINNGEYEYTKL